MLVGVFLGCSYVRVLGCVARSVVLVRYFLCILPVYVGHLMLFIKNFDYLQKNKK